MMMIDRFKNLSKSFYFFWSLILCGEKKSKTQKKMIDKIKIREMINQIVFYESESESAQSLHVV